MCKASRDESAHCSSSYENICWGVGYFVKQVAYVSTRYFNIPSLGLELYKVRESRNSSQRNITRYQQLRLNRSTLPEFQVPTMASRMPQEPLTSIQHDACAFFWRIPFKNAEGEDNNRKRERRMILCLGAAFRLDCDTWIVTPHYPG